MEIAVVLINVINETIKFVIYVVTISVFNKVNTTVLIKTIVVAMRITDLR